MRKQRGDTRIMPTHAAHQLVIDKCRKELQATFFVLILRINLLAHCGTSFEERQLDFRWNKVQRAVQQIHTTTVVPQIPEGLREFFDNEQNFGVNELRPSKRPGRSWSVDELRLKSNSDLHRLWYGMIYFCSLYS